MTGRGPTDTGWGTRIPAVSRLAGAACAAIAAALVLAQCSAGGSDAAGVAAGSPFASRVGSLIQADSLANTVIGGHDRTSLSFRFRAQWTGSVTSVRVYLISNNNATGRTGYSLGNGGRRSGSLRAPARRGAPHPAGPLHSAAPTPPPSSGGNSLLLTTR